MKRLIAAALAAVALLQPGLAPAQPPKPAYVTGSPVTGAIAKASGPQSVTTGDLSGDCTTSSTLATICLKTNGVNFGYFATGTDAANLTGTVACARLPALTGDVTTSAGACATAIGANKVTLADVAQIGANTVLGNATASTANVAAQSMPSCSSASSALTWTTSSGFGCNTISSGGTGANPTATASDTAVNGVATTFMRSDAAPPVQKATSSVFGLVKVDGTTITASGGVISAPANVPPAAANALSSGSDSTSSTSYGNLASTTGPSVTMTTGTSVLVAMTGYANKPSGSGNTALISVAVSGASSVAASDNNSARGSSPNTGFNFALSGLVVLTGLTAGSNTFTLKYRVDGSTFNFGTLGIAVFRLN